MPFFFIVLADFESPCSKELFSIYDLKKKKKSHVKAKEFFYQFVGFGSQKLPVLQVEQACLLACLRGCGWGNWG